ncbi:acyltransferase [Duganella sp. sic0402]|uniref:acyltransferase family protein n=1 Tax=Duganella sp. sic0402 TaxID=2854786 RepID=UPI001C44E8DB|nr:acyltransferase [Duganella sp. sic0402]MBV7535962.1 acyltransferase [Duganella sp. sic0402]
MKNMSDMRNENLQILRFVAAALVLVTHITFYLHDRISSAHAIWHGGEIGVPIFFVISGFVMYLSGAKLDRDASSAKFFLARRVARVFPLYWLITTFKLAIVILAPAAALHNRPDLWQALASYVLFPTLNAAGEVRPLHGVGWTLLHEMLFYYVFSLSLLLRQSPFICSAVIIGALWGAGFFLPADTALAQVLFSPLNLLFIAGMALAWQYQHGRRLPLLAAVLALVIGIATIVSPEIGETLHRMLGGFNAGAVLIVAAMLSLQLNVVPAFKKLLVRLGDSSYSLYLIHPIAAPIICVGLFKLHVQSPYVILPIAFVASVIAAHFVYLLVENPLNKAAWKLLKRTLFSQAPTPILTEK